MNIKRDYYIDFLRGLAAINIIIIHTAFWSGEQYVPNFIKSITLLLDVPLFFFLAGWSFSYVKSSVKTIKGFIKLQEKYVFFLVVYTIILLIFTREDVSVINFINEVFYKQTIPSKLLPVVMGSIWFLPIYFAVSSIFSIIISSINKEKDNNLHLILLGMCLMGFMYTQLGYNFFYLSRDILFYGFFYVLGYICKDYKISNYRSLCVILISILSCIILFGCVFNVDITVIQNLKFPPHIIYLLMSLIGIVISLYIKGRILFDKNNFIVKIGQRAIFYYFGQGISSSILYYYIDIINIQWYFKFLICVFINISLGIIISECLYKIYNVWNNIRNKFVNKYCEKLKLFFS